MVDGNFDLESLGKVTTLLSQAQEYIDNSQPLIDWCVAHWSPIVLTAEIIGSVIAIKTGKYRKGLIWLGLGLITIWVGKI